MLNLSADIEAYCIYVAWDSRTLRMMEPEDWTEAFKEWYGQD